MRKRGARLQFLTPEEDVLNAPELSCHGASIWRAATNVVGRRKIYAIQFEDGTEIVDDEAVIAKERLRTVRIIVSHEAVRGYGHADGDNICAHVEP